MSGKKSCRNTIYEGEYHYFRRSGTVSLCEQGIAADRGRRLKCPNEHGYVFIHDGARPFLTEKILEDTYAAAVQYQACVAAVQSKDTVKISDGNGFALSTPDRRSVWNIQTPQVFETSLILQAYERLKNRLPKLQEQGIQVTDDASVVEMFTESRVKLVEASYQNIKITTPEDMKTAEAFLEE